MAQFSMEIICLTGSVPRGNQQSGKLPLDILRRVVPYGTDPKLVAQHIPAVGIARCVRICIGTVGFRFSHGEDQ